MNLARHFLMLLYLLMVPFVSGRAQQEDPNANNASNVEPQQAPDGSSPADPFFPSPFNQVRKSLSFGATILQGISFSSQDPGSSSNEKFTAVLPHVALDLSRGRMQLLFESSPVISYVPSKDVGFGINGFIDPRVNFDVSLSRRWRLDTALEVSYGSQFSHVIGLSSLCSAGCDRVSARSTASPLQSGQEESSVARTVDVAMDEPSNPPSLVSSLAASTFYAYGEATLNWQRTTRQNWGFTFGKSYSTSSDLTVTLPNDVFSNVTFARAQVSEGVTPLTNLVVYSQVHYVRSGTFSCGSAGTGLGFQQQLGRETAWSIESGPEFGDRGCSNRLGIGVVGSFRHVLVNRTLLIFSAGHTQDSYYVPGSRWATSVDGALHRQLTDRTFFELNGGYLSGSQEKNQLAAFSGFYFSPNLVWKASGIADVRVAYGHLILDRGSGSSLNRDWILAGFTWHSRAKQL